TIACVSKMRYRYYAMKRGKSIKARVLRAGQSATVRRVVRRGVISFVHSLEDGDGAELAHRPLAAEDRRLLEREPVIEVLLAVELEDDAVALALVRDRDEEILAAGLRAGVRRDEHRDGAVLAGDDRAERAVLLDRDARPGDGQLLAAQIVGLVAEPDFSAEDVRLVREVLARDAGAEEVVAEPHVREDRDAGELRARRADARLQARAHREDEAEARHDQGHDHRERLDEPHRLASAAAAEEGLNGLRRGDSERARLLLAGAEAAPEDEVAAPPRLRPEHDRRALAVQRLAVE